MYEHLTDQLNLHQFDVMYQEFVETQEHGESVYSFVQWCIKRIWDKDRNIPNRIEAQNALCYWCKSKGLIIEGVCLQ